MSDVVIRVENISKLYRLGEVGTGSLAHDVNRWWHKVRGKEDPYLKIGEVNDRTKPAKQARADGTTNHTNKHEKLTTDGSDGHGYGTAGRNQRADSAEFLEGHSQAGLQMDSEKLASIRSANDSRASGDQNGSSAESVLIRDISGKKSSSVLDSGPSPLDSTHGLRAGEFFAVKDVSFALRRGECLGLIGHNGAGNQAAGQPLGRLPQAARRVRRRGKARINMTLLKMLNGLIKPDAGSITMRGRVGTGCHPELTGCARSAQDY